MAKKKDAPPAEELEVSSDASKNMLTALLNGYKETHYNFNKIDPTIITSGSLILDSVVTVKTGTTLRMGGPAEVGKTSQALLFAQNFMATMPKAKTIYVNAESKFPKELEGRTGMKFVFAGDQWEANTVFVLESNVFDTICDILANLLKVTKENGEHLCIIIDSVDMLTLVGNLEKKISDGKKPAGVNYLTKELFRRISPQIRAYNALLIMITQYAATFKLDQYEKDVPNLMDGNQTHALNHQASYALYYRPRYGGNYILENPKDKKPDPQTNKILGVYAKIDVRKSSSDNTGYMVEVPIVKGRVGNCVWTEKEVADMCVAYQLVSGSQWLTFDGQIVKEAKDAGIEIKDKVNGINKLYEYLSEEKATCDWLKNKVYSITQLRLQLTEG
jgi:RecA/RadA recombinase